MGEVTTCNDREVAGRYIEATESFNSAVMLWFATYDSLPPEPVPVSDLEKASEESLKDSSKTLEAVAKFRNETGASLGSSEIFVKSTDHNVEGALERWKSVSTGEWFRCKNP